MRGGSFVTKSKSLASPIGFMSGSTIKIIACILMCIDHMGLLLFPGQMIYRVIGRLAFPLFAFFMAEGSKYSRKNLRRFLLLFSFGMAYLGVYYVVAGDIYASIFLTFSISVALNALIDVLKKWVFTEFSVVKCVVSVLTVALAVFGIWQLCNLILFDYGFIGAMIPVAINMFTFKGDYASERLKSLDIYSVRLLILLLGLIVFSIKNIAFVVEIFGITFPLQFFSVVSVVLLLFYNGRVGNKHLKYFFYIFYPSHIVVLEIIAIIISVFYAYTGTFMISVSDFLTAII